MIEECSHPYCDGNRVSTEGVRGGEGVKVLQLQSVSQASSQSAYRSSRNVSFCVDVEGCACGCVDVDGGGGQCSDEVS